MLKNFSYNEQITHSKWDLKYVTMEKCTLGPACDEQFNSENALITNGPSGMRTFEKFMSIKSYFLRKNMIAVTSSLWAGTVQARLYRIDGTYRETFRNE